MLQILVHSTMLTMSGDLRSSNPRTKHPALLGLPDGARASISRYKGRLGAGQRVAVRKAIGGQGPTSGNRGGPASTHSFAEMRCGCILFRWNRDPMLIPIKVMEEPENEITITVFRLLVLDLLALFQALNQGMINILGMASLL